MKKNILIALMLAMVANAFAVEVEINGLWYELVSKTKEAKVIQYKNDIKYSGDIVIPEIVEYEGVNCSVTNIGESAFYNCDNLTSITIPNSVISIGSCGFQDCVCLNSITIPSSVTNIGDKAFSGCKKLKKLHVDDSDNVLSFEQEKRTATYTPKKFNFFNCPLDTIYLGRDYTYTTISPFKDNTSISVLEFGDKVTAVGINDFYNCSSIESIKLGGSVKTIGGFAFWGNQSLKTIVIPNSVTYLGRGAFYECI